MLPCVCRIQEIPPCPATNNRIKNFTKYEGELNMKKQFVKALVLILALVLCLSLPLSVSAATTADATIDPNAMCSLSIYKYDFTNGATRS